MLLQLLSTILFAGTVAALAIWITLSIRVWRTGRRDVHLRRGVDLPPPKSGWPKVSIVIPAHDEQRVIDDCLRAVRAQDYGDVEIILVLDRCTDDTLVLARAHADEDPRVTIIENEDCPDDWAGKCNAARVGAARATGDFILFTDADTAFEPELVRASVAIAIDRDLALLSLLSKLSARHAFERVVQPVASLTLIGMYPLDRPAHKKKSFANGQFMLFRRRDYDAIGGHDAVKDDLLEDIAFARVINGAGGKSAVMFSDGLLRVSMYDSYAAFRSGWRRIFMEASRRKPPRLRKEAVRALFAGLVFPAMCVGAVVLGAITLDLVLLITASVTLVLQFLSLRAAYRMGGQPGTSALFHFWGCWVVAGILFEAARHLESGVPVRWGGRAYVLEPNDPGVAD